MLKVGKCLKFSVVTLGPEYYGFRAKEIFEELSYLMDVQSSFPTWVSVKIKKCNLPTIVSFTALYKL